LATTAISSDQDVIITEIEIAAPPERVFQAITDPEQQRVWWKSNALGKNNASRLKSLEMDARPGGEWSFSTETLQGISYDHHGKVLEIRPPHLLVYTWFRNFHEDLNHETIVRWELTPTPNGTKLKVTHSGLAQEPKARKDYRGGWPGVLQAIKNYVEHN